MKKLFLSILILATGFLFVFTGCGSCKETADDELKVEVKINEVNSWLNLMPGTEDDDSFHLSGELTLVNNEEFDLKEIELNNIYIYQNDELIYKLDSNLIEKFKVKSRILSSGEERNYTFGNSKNVLIKPELDSEKTIKAVLIFSTSEKSFKKIIENIRIEKVY